MSARIEVGQYLPDWRPGRDYRDSHSARADFGGSVEFELSHEIDYACWLFGQAVSVDALLAHTSDLEIAVDDTAELLLRFDGGAIASVHMDMAQRSPVRTCRIAGVAGTLTWDGIAAEVRRYTPDEGWKVLHAGDGDRNDMYVAEMAHLLACARGETEPSIGGSDALRAVRIALAARRASEEGRRIEL
jgi:predicted dehydrogenase